MKKSPITLIVLILLSFGMSFSLNAEESGILKIISQSEGAVFQPLDRIEISGPWKEQKIIYEQNGGHGMIFSSFDGQLMMALHQPNNSPGERLHLFQITDSGDTMDIKKEVDLR